MPSRKIELSIMDNDLTTLTDEELDAVAAGQASFKGRGTGSATGTKSAAVTITVEGTVKAAKDSFTSSGFVDVSASADIPETKAA
jgi:hypothetical protein